MASCKTMVLMDLIFLLTIVLKNRVINTNGKKTELIVLGERKRIHDN